ncbi:MAG: Rrf2 family transcriptional regulator [Proteobacteria bacterium]|nr:Rrf2 family transcriptional regulator [Pseudomonadota bacterium]
MRITQWGEYGIHFSLFLAKQEKKGIASVGASEIAESQGIDTRYAQQILQRLRKGNIVKSVRGPQGGYKLTKSPAEITLLDILIAAEGDSFEVICNSKPIDNHRCAPKKSCGLRGIWHNLKDLVNNFLSDYTLEKLLNISENDREFINDDMPIQIGRGLRL